MDLKSGLLLICGAVLAVAAIFAIAGSTTASNTVSNLSDYKGTLSVSGTGYVYAAPDTALVSIGVVTEATTSTGAMGDNANAMDAVMKAMRNLGIMDKDMQTSTISVQPKYSYQYPVATPEGSSAAGSPASSSGAISSAIYPPYPVETKISGYTATNTITVKVHDLSKVGPVIDAAYGAGANQINGVTFTLSDDRAQAVYDQALQLAVAQAKDKARTIADAAGLGDIKLQTITESGNYYPIYFAGAASGAMDKAAAAPTPVSPGEQKVSATVSMVYVYVPQ